ncbi:MAG TPA: type II secretion system F family protein [Verrucomicrobiae bacterium]|nr:type II secretion system F family protein [Verrucomicrobiae bacterium]
MPDYQYIARTKTGEIEKDVISAFNEKTVVETLRSRGLMPTSIKVTRGSFDYKKILASFSSIKLIDKITFIKNLSVMTKAGLPVSRTLGILAEQVENKKFGAIIANITKQVESGTALADALGKYPNVFSPIFVSMVRVGEISGNLEQSLNYLAEQMQRDYDLVSKAKGALTYPIIVLVALFAVGVLMFTFVLPKLTSTFVDLNVELPLMTKVVIGIVDIFAKYGLLIIPLMVMAAIGFVFWRKTPTGKQIIHKLVLMVPVFSQIVVKINLARFVRTFSSLIKSGMSIVEALEISSHVVGNIYYQKIISEASSKVRIGSPLASGFKKYPKMFSSIVIQMMEVGEESGTTDVVLAEVAEFYESEVDQQMKNLSSVIEPMIMMFVGIVVGILAVALITPIYNITQSIS